MTSQTPENNNNHSSSENQSAKLGTSEQKTQQTGSDSDSAHTDSNQMKAPDEQFCESCGSVIKKEADICPNCGVRNRQSTRKGGNKVPKEPMGRMESAGIGGLVAFIGSIFPLVGIIAGGIVTGFLRGENTRESSICGAYAGTIASIPTVLLFGLLFFFGAVGGATEGFSSFAGVIIGGGIMLIIFISIYIGLGALGGFIGATITDRGSPDTVS